MRESVSGVVAAAGILLCAFSAFVAADEDCLGYLDKDGKWNSGFDCKFNSFCCGNCFQRYCCSDTMNLITERQQKRCLIFSPKMIAGVASAILLFLVVISIVICCFMCSCCYLYQRQQGLRSAHQGQEMQIMGYPAAYPVQPGYPMQSKPGPAPPYPGYAPVSMYPPGPPIYNPVGPGEGYPSHAPVHYPMYPPGPPAGYPTAPTPPVPPQPTYPSV